VVWVYGGGGLGGSKEELAGYLKVLASYGYAVVGPRHALAPEHRYPAPTSHVMLALGHPRDNAERLRLDPDRTVLAGDSARAQIAAQVGLRGSGGRAPSPQDRAVGLSAYSGRRRFLQDAAFATCSVTNHLTPTFPPTLLTVGNADPLRPHSELLDELLRAQGLEPETLFSPPTTTLRSLTSTSSSWAPTPRGSSCSGCWRSWSGD
jgi:acetyl esterase/lipase